MTDLQKIDSVPEYGSRALRPSLRGRVCSPWFICVVAFVVRILAICLVQSSHTGQMLRIWDSGPEIVNIATSIAGHRGFSSPFGIESGDTAWIPPIYPSLLAAIFMLLGPRSNAAAVTVLAMQALFSAITCIPLHAIAKRTFNEQSAVWIGWGWALFPYEVVMPGLFVWETFLSGFLVVLLCQLSTSDRKQHRWMPLGIGILWGVAALTNTALISLMPVFLFAPYSKRDLGNRRRAIALTILVCCLVVCPWMLRNWRVLHAIVPVRSNFGEELWMGNHAGGNGRIEFGLGPSDNAVELERYRSLGEIAYVRHRRIEALRFIRQSAARFFRLFLYRFRYWWFAEGENAAIFYSYRLLTLMSFGGIALALRECKGVRISTLLGTIIVFPFVYYVTDVYARYRYPIEPLLMIFAGYGLSRAFAISRNKIVNT
jgi:4-amino-4-deoxy-L-arabinose transferase and related glycosyltransferases of PMT family